MVNGQHDKCFMTVAMGSFTVLEVFRSGYKVLIRVEMYSAAGDGTKQSLVIGRDHQLHSKVLNGGDHMRSPMDKYGLRRL